MFQPKSNYLELFSVPLKVIHCPFLSLTECHGSERERGREAYMGGVTGRKGKEKQDVIIF